MTGWQVHRGTSPLKILCSEMCHILYISAEDISEKVPFEQSIPIPKNPIYCKPPSFFNAHFLQRIANTLGDKNIIKTWKPHFFAVIIIRILTTAYLKWSGSFFKTITKVLDSISGIFLNHNKGFRWHLGDYEKHIFFPFEGLWEEKLWFLCVFTDV